MNKEKTSNSDIWDNYLSTNTLFNSLLEPIPSKILWLRTFMTPYFPRNKKIKCLDIGPGLSEMLVLLR